MSRFIFISHLLHDTAQAKSLEQRLRGDNYDVFRSASDTFDAVVWDHEIAPRIKTCLAVAILVTPDSATSEHIMRECTYAQFHNKTVVAIVIRRPQAVPYYLDKPQAIQLVGNIDDIYAQLVAILPESASQPTTLGDARDSYLQRATLRSSHTLAAYKRAIEQFLQFLGDRDYPTLLPIQQSRFTIADEIPLSRLSDRDAPILLHFAQWLLSPGTNRKGDNRPYKESTVELRVSGVQNWLQYLDDYGLLPADFPLAKARRMAREELRHKTGAFSAPRPPDYIEEVIYFYDHQQLPAHLRKPTADSQQVRRWELTRLRNRALLYSLAETGGRISEVLSLNISDFPVRYLAKQEVLRVEVVGKGNHSYYLRFYDALPAIKAYIDARGPDLKASGAKVPLFVSHDVRYDGSRMSRVVAWRVVQRAARALGLGNITPHDFRHWRATQLINAGHSLDVVQDYLGHRSVETTRAYYAHTDPLRVDNAAKETPLPDPENSE